MCLINNIYARTDTGLMWAISEWKNLCMYLYVCVKCIRGNERRKKKRFITHRTTVIFFFLLLLLWTE